MKIKLFRILTMIALAASTLTAAAQDALEPYRPLQRDGNRIETLKHMITIGPSGLPEQIFIKAHNFSLPLEARDGGAALNDAPLIDIGRGPQLRSPVRLEAVSQGNRIPAEVRTPAAVANQSPGAITFASKLAAGPIEADVKTRVEYDGAMIFEITFGGNAANTEILELVLEVAGPVNFAYRGLPSNFQAEQAGYDKLDVSLPADNEAVVWTSNHEWIGAAGGPFVRYLTIGSHDRAFTWICDSRDGFVIAPNNPMMQIERNTLGDTTLRIRLIGREGDLGGRRSVKFALITHPSSPRPEGMRNTQWLGWLPGAPAQNIDGVERTTLAARERLIAAGTRTIMPALTAGALESLALGYELRGQAGADVVSPQLDNVRLYPESLFAVFAGTFRNRPTRIVSNNAQVIAGGNPSYDRQLLGRALAHDIGVALQSLHQPVEYLRFVSALKEFGLFDDDNTEIIPYWRNQRYLRYGEAWDADDQFRLDVENPAAKVYVTAFRRRLVQDGRSGYKVLFIIFNGNDYAVRERLYIMDAVRLFGGRNSMTSLEGQLALDYSTIPDDADWSPRLASGPYGIGTRRRMQALMDLEDGGFVQQADRQNPPQEIYGPLFVYPRDFRIVFGYWLPEQQ